MTITSKLWSFTIAIENIRYLIYKIHILWNFSVKIRTFFRKCRDPGCSSLNSSEVETCIKCNFARVATPKPSSNARKSEKSLWVGDSNFKSHNETSSDSQHSESTSSTSAPPKKSGRVSKQKPVVWKPHKENVTSTNVTLTNVTLTNVAPTNVTSANVASSKVTPTNVATSYQTPKMSKNGLSECDADKLFDQLEAKTAILLKKHPSGKAFWNIVSFAFKRNKFSFLGEYSDKLNSGESCGIVFS